MFPDLPTQSCLNIVDLFLSYHVCDLDVKHFIALLTFCLAAQHFHFDSTE
jgi:hypothetical protein